MCTIFHHLLSGCITSIPRTEPFNWTLSVLVSEKLPSARSRADACLGWIACLLSGALTFSLWAYILSSLCFSLSVLWRKYYFQIGNYTDAFKQRNCLFWLKLSLTSEIILKNHINPAAKSLLFKAKLVTDCGSERRPGNNNRVIFI